MKPFKKKNYRLSWSNRPNMCAFVAITDIFI